MRAKLCWRCDEYVEMPVPPRPDCCCTDTSDPLSELSRRAPRQVRMFSTPTQITFTEDPVKRRTIVELIAGDRPGLLSHVAKVFMAERVDIHNSKIMTVGERAEDVFYVADESGRPLTSEAQQRLAQRLTESLDRRA